MSIPQAVLKSIERSLSEYESLNGVEMAALKFKFALRKLLLAFNDWPVRHRIGGINLLLPLSHNLSIDDAAAPGRSDNLSRIAGLLCAQVRDFHVIDIGANVGDSVAILRSTCRFPILAIEGDHEFYSYLSKNVENISEVWTFEGLLNDSPVVVQGSLVKNYGGSKQVDFETEDKGTLRFYILPEVLERFPEFRNAHFVKIDTDGFDCKIIRGALEWLGTVRPTIYFEYDPQHLMEQQDDGISIFHDLLAIGYDGVLVFEENGDFMRTLSLHDSRSIEELHSYYHGRRSKKYANLCVFHEVHQTQFEAARTQELEHVAEKRSLKIHPQ